MLAQGCASSDSRPIYSPDTVTQHKIDMGFTGDLGVGPTLGHSVPVDGEIISTPLCVSEVRAGKECKN
jgi:hypothetical protein